MPPREVSSEENRLRTLATFATSGCSKCKSTMMLPGERRPSSSWPNSTPNAAANAPRKACRSKVAISEASAARETLKGKPVFASTNKEGTCTARSVSETAWGEPPANSLQSQVVLSNGRCKCALSSGVSAQRGRRSLAANLRQPGCVSGDECRPHRSTTNCRPSLARKLATPPGGRSVSTISAPSAGSSTKNASLRPTALPPRATGAPAHLPVSDAEATGASTSQRWWPPSKPHMRPNCAGN
mmetsp:Transcript_68822/g.178742  ORF Transcript_68822/g.178742 Transcript_68822/m.178742 type:complete len:242 (+) Transcript_68822:150-875(+)